jgi:hypothetical protein
LLLLLLLLLLSLLLLLYPITATFDPSQVHTQLRVFHAALPAAV